jgi:predicted HTH transcriptional regulator
MAIPGCERAAVFIRVHVILGSMMEDLRTEFKREWDKKYLRNVAALANSDGGAIYIGVEDDGAVCGLKNLKDSLKQIPDDVQNVLGIVPAVDCHVEGGNTPRSRYRRAAGLLTIF